jgi:multidrug resistance efflux pump
MILLLASVLGAGWGLRKFSNGGHEPTGTLSKDSASPLSTKRVVCLGYADVESGIVNLTPAVAGRVSEVFVKENELVKAGTVLLRTEDNMARHQLEEAEAALRAAEAQLNEARKAPESHELLIRQQKEALAAVRYKHEAARLAAEHKRKLVADKLLSEVEAKAAEELVKEIEAAERAGQDRLKMLELRDPTNDVTRAEEDVRAKQAQVEKARRALAECELRAPSDGMVLRLLTRRGDMVSPQSPRPALLFCPAGPRIVRAEVEQEFVPRVTVGQRVVVHDDSSGDATAWTGRVARMADWFMQRRTILPDTMPLLDVRTLECVIELDPGQPPPRIGQRVRVTIGE